LNQFEANEALVGLRKCLDEEPWDPDTEDIPASVAFFVHNDDGTVWRAL
jgi:hypothetical protein